MNLSIDWGFIAKLEGASNIGYVPDVNHSRSGVTIASGVDLSAENEASLAGLPLGLQLKLRPYLEMSGTMAVVALRAQPLALTDEEVATLNAYVDGHAATAIASAYHEATALDFEDLPTEAQTVITSVGFQYGDIARRCPNFWHHAITQDWAGCVAELRNFGDRYSTRHAQEADYLARLVS